ncbi:ImmA/IrrE family metallo-endopeptidase [Ornithinibacillus gellani]|uniref:ImmA/IrrE family metallo-endopeptidase n=1 Tax=Ornithinibacillus gellani TaxID=2293253 RepID=UPI000F47618E|nr:ImmA/IrrE family metallo-endopeptidase [Ornithinibacillus gellani]TQS71925.1 ImmA/IrrE family metallo-endopeptidase [Ornithinibacillus gellani]
MGKLHSFKYVIHDLYYDELFNKLASFVEGDPSRLESESNLVLEPDEAELIDFEVKWINLTGSPDNYIFFDVIVESQVLIAETIKREKEIDDITQWFRISCRAILENGLHEFSVTDIAVYIKEKQNGHHQLSEYLVPIISKNQLDEIAEGFLKKYYPKALTVPMKVPPKKIAEIMGLKIVQVHITKTGIIFGQIYFSNAITKIYDMRADTYKKVKVKRGTILIDPDVFFMRNVGSLNNTIIHECVHWELHKKFFELESLYNPEARGISCQVIEGAKPESNRTPLDWMEWQANALAPRILMPKSTTKQKIEEFIIKHKESQKTSHSLYEVVINELAEFFGVSKVAAKIRMIDLGYKQAMGIFNYIDEKYVPSHSFDEEALKNNQTFSISAHDLLFEYAVRPKLREMIDSGNFLYVDSHVCINDPKYIEYDINGYVKLTNYARNHIDECCLIFDIKVKVNNQYGFKSYKKSVLFRNVASDRFVEVSFSESSHNMGAEEKAKEIKKMSDKANKIATIQRQLPFTFGESVVSHMERLDFTVEKLAEAADISDKTVQRIRNEINYRPKFGTIIAICVGLKLPPPLSEDLIRKSGNIYIPGNQKHILYQMIINGMYHCPIEVCNELMIGSNFNKLSKED